jgi:large subunit ribosomal protein L22
MAFGLKTNERPGTRAQARYARVSAYKAREVLDLIRGESYGKASEILQFSDRQVATTIKKVLDSAVANAEHNDDIPAEEVFVSACYADEGPTLKRFTPRARGRGMRIRKRTCHITVIVSRYSVDQLTKLRASAGQGGAARSSASAAEARRRRVQSSRELADTRKAEEEAHDHEGHDHEGHDHGPADSAESAAKDAAAQHGPGSAAPLADGSGPEGFEIKGNADSMLYHLPGGRHYKVTKAEVYFDTVESAEAAGFTAPASASAADDTEPAEGEDA